MAPPNFAITYVGDTEVNESFTGPRTYDDEVPGSGQVIVSDVEDRPPPFQNHLADSRTRRKIGDARAQRGGCFLVMSLIPAGLLGVPRSSLSVDHSRAGR